MSIDDIVEMLRSPAGGVSWLHAVDEVAALDFDDDGMQTRMRLVEAGVCSHLIASLDVMDSDVRCKAANALGCLCANSSAATAVLRCQPPPIVALPGSHCATWQGRASNSIAGVHGDGSEPVAAGVSRPAHD